MDRNHNLNQCFYLSLTWFWCWCYRGGVLCRIWREISKTRQNGSCSSVYSNNMDSYWVYKSIESDGWRGDWHCRLIQGPYQYSNLYDMKCQLWTLTKWLALKAIFFLLHVKYLVTIMLLCKLLYIFMIFQWPTCYS